MLEDVISRAPARKKLIERLKSENTHKLTIPNGNTPAATKKRAYATTLCSNTVDTDLEGKELEYCLQAIRSLTAVEVKSNSKYIRELLRNWFNKYYASADTTLASNLRRAICWIDEALNMEDCK